MAQVGEFLNLLCYEYLCEAVGLVLDDDLFLPEEGAVGDPSSKERLPNNLFIRDLMQFFESEPHELGNYQTVKRDQPSDEVKTLHMCASLLALLENVPRWMN